LITARTMDLLSDIMKNSNSSFFGKKRYYRNVITKMLENTDTDGYNLPFSESCNAQGMTFKNSI